MDVFRPNDVLCNISYPKCLKSGMDKLVKNLNTSCSDCMTPCSSVEFELLDVTEPNKYGRPDSLPYEETVKAIACRIAYPYLRRKHHEDNGVEQSVTVDYKYPKSNDYFDCGAPNKKKRVCEVVMCCDPKPNPSCPSCCHCECKCKCRCKCCSSACPYECPCKKKAPVKRNCKRKSINSDCPTPCKCEDDDPCKRRSASRAPKLNKCTQSEKIQSECEKPPCMTQKEKDLLAECEKLMSYTRGPNPSKKAKSKRSPPKSDCPTPCVCGDVLQETDMLSKNRRASKVLANRKAPKTVKKITIDDCPCPCQCRRICKRLKAEKEAMEAKSAELAEKACHTKQCTPEEEAAKADCPCPAEASHSQEKNCSFKEKMARRRTDTKAIEAFQEHQAIRLSDFEQLWQVRSRGRNVIEFHQDKPHSMCRSRCCSRFASHCYPCTDYC